jgi:hypothetical protein
MVELCQRRNDDISGYLGYNSFVIHGGGAVKVGNDVL